MNPHDLRPRPRPSRRQAHDRVPVLGVGAVVFKDRSVLLVKRGHAPSKGQWAIPGGRVRWGETLQQAAERELLEETGIHIHAKEPVFNFELIELDSAGRCQLHYVVVDLGADYLGGELRAGDDATEARWVSSSEIDSLPVNDVTRTLLKTRFDFG